MNYNYFNRIGLFTVIVLMMGCSDPTPFDHVPHDVRPILEKAIEQAGGLETWKNAPGFKFNKRSILYLKDGTVESKNNQIVQFKDHPQLSGTITWNNREDTITTKIEYSNGAAIKYLNGVPQSAEINEAARRTFLGAHMVMSLPFKLLDPGVKLTYAGEEEQFGKKVKVIISDYDDHDNANHTGSHRWWHYFDSDNYEYLGYKVYHAPTYALAENEVTTKLNGITYAVDRVTWRVDSLDNKQFIRAKFAYSDYKSLGE